VADVPGRWRRSGKAIVTSKLQSEAGCQASITPVVKMGPPLSATQTFRVDSVSKVVSTPGDVIKVTGQKFASNLSLRAPEGAGLADDGGQRVAGKVTVVSDTEATVALPRSINFGLFTLSFSQDGVEQNVTLFSNGGKTDYPVMTVAAEEICSGKKFYDDAGSLRTGTKDCAAVSLPSCSQDGAVGCVSTAGFAAADTSGLSAKIVAGNTVAGIVGTTVAESYSSCAVDGASGCVATSTYPAANLAGFSSGDIRSGVTVAGVAGVLTGAPSSCTADGGSIRQTTHLFS